MGAFAASFASILVHFLNQFALPRKSGCAFSEVLFDFGPGRNKRRPDVAFVAWDRWTEDPPDPAQDPSSWKVIPNLAVEVISPNNKAEEIENKVVEYFQAGVDRVWVIYPRLKRVYVYTSAKNPKVLELDDELDGDGFLPGFQLKVADIFAALTKPK